MNARATIRSVFHDIVYHLGITPYKNNIEFRFNRDVVGQGIATADEELKVLLKLEKEKIIELSWDDPFSGFPSGYATVPTKELEGDQIEKYQNVYIEVGKKFWLRYYLLESPVFGKIWSFATLPFEKAFSFFEKYPRASGIIGLCTVMLLLKQGPKEILEAIIKMVFKS